MRWSIIMKGKENKIIFFSSFFGDLHFVCRSHILKLMLTMSWVHLCNVHVNAQLHLPANVKVKPTKHNIIISRYLWCVRVVGARCCCCCSYVFRLDQRVQNASIICIKVYLLSFLPVTLACLMFESCSMFNVHSNACDGR